MRSWQRAVVAMCRAFLVMAALGTTGCAGLFRLLDRGAGMGSTVSPGIFWPPPGSTTVALAEPSVAGTSVSLGEAAARAATVLDDAGYTSKHWFPIGARCAHGFAVTTRLEKMDPGGARASAPQRWSTLFPEPMTLTWLGEATRPRLPESGTYRAFLVAFSDLHVRRRGQPPRMDETTLMQAPDGSATEFPAARRVPPSFRFGAYIYEYASSGDDGDGAFMSADDRASAYQQLERSGLASLMAPASE